MGNVLFEEEKSYGTTPGNVAGDSAFITYVKKAGLAKTTKEAEIVLVWIIGIAVLVAIGVVWASFGGSDEPVELPPVPPSTQVYVP